MTRYHYDFFGDLLVEVVGQDGRTDTQFRKMFDHYRVASPDREPDMVIRETTEDVDPEVVLGDPNDYYGWTGEKFVVHNNGYMAVEPGWDHIDVSPGFEPFYLIYPMELKIRQQKIERGQALIHASGVSLHGQTTLFPAWRGGGKTNTLLSLLREGAGFLSDDRLWVGADGSALGYPLGVNLGPYNIGSFPEIELEHDTREERIRHEAHEFIDKKVEKGASLPETAVSFLNDTLLGSSNRDFTDVTSVYPDADFVEESDVDNVVFLQAAPEADNVSVRQISTDEAMSGVTAICNFEWDGRLREYFHAYDALVEGGDMVETLDEVIQKERDIFRELFEDVEVYRANVPREADWGEVGLDSAMVDMVTSFGEQDGANDELTRKTASASSD